MPAWVPGIRHATGHAVRIPGTDLSTQGVIMGRFVMAAAGVVLGVGALVLTGAGAASAQGTGGSACQQVQATLSAIQSTLPSAASNPSVLKSKVGTFASQLEKEASSGSPALKSAVGAFVADLQAAGSGHASVAKLTSDANAIGAACQAQATAPRGAPATGGGSTASSGDPALFGAGGAAVLAGFGALGLAWRRQRRNRAHQV